MEVFNRLWSHAFSFLILPSITTAIENSKGKQPATNMKKLYQQNLFTRSNAKLPSQNYCIRVHQSKLKFNYQLLITLAVEKNKIMHVVCEA